MDDPTWTWPGPGVIADGLPDDLLGRIKSELAPGEWLLWAAQPVPRPLRIGRGYLCAALFVAIFLGAGGFCLGIYFGAFGPDFVNPAGVLLAFGLITGSLGSIGVLGMVGTWFEERAERDGLARESYAVTDRRVILWRPQPGAAVEVHSLRRGQVGQIHRHEVFDGSGEIRFSLRGERDERTGLALRIGRILEVRRVEELVRRTLLGTAWKPENP